jgi:uncharacterized membrane protein YebE (DUF533 family)
MSGDNLFFELGENEETEQYLERKMPRPRDMPEIVSKRKDKDGE